MGILFIKFSLFLIVSVFRCTLGVVTRKECVFGHSV